MTTLQEALEGRDDVLCPQCGSAFTVLIVGVLHEYGPTPGATTLIVTNRLMACANCEEEFEVVDEWEQSHTDRYGNGRK